MVICNSFLGIEGWGFWPKSPSGEQRNGGGEQRKRSSRPVAVAMSQGDCRLYVYVHVHDMIHMYLYNIQYVIDCKCMYTYTICAYIVYIYIIQITVYYDPQDHENYCKSSISISFSARIQPLLFVVDSILKKASVWGAFGARLGPTTMTDLSQKNMVFIMVFFHNS